MTRATKGMIGLSISTEKETLIETEDENSARFVEILSNKFGYRLTVGNVYEISRNFDSPYLYDEHGEMYVIDDDGEATVGFQAMCGTKFYT